MRPRWVSAGLLLAFVLFLGFMVGASKAVHECERQHQRHQAAIESVRVFGYKIVSGRCVWTFLEQNDKALVVLATIGLLVVTATLAYYTFGLWQSTQTLSKDTAAASSASILQMQSQEKRQLRAYVGVAVAGYYPATTTHPLAFRIEIKNYGQTPAYDLIVVSMNRVVLPFPLKEVSQLDDAPDPDPHEPQRTVLNPQASPITFRSSRKLPQIPPDDLAAVNQPIVPEGEHPAQLYCFGTVRYRDIFLDSHWVHYCAMFGGDLMQSSESAGAMCHLYNDTSDNPADGAS